jgi:hypothetical protein
MADWKTRLAVQFVDNNNKTVEISPIDSFTPSFSLNAEVLHSIEKTHIGVVYSPQAISFSMTVKAIGDVAGQLTVLALKGTRFDIILLEGTGSDWSFKKIVLGGCVITSATPSAATISGSPAATFSGVCLNASADTKAAGQAAIPLG